MCLVKRSENRIESKVIIAIVDVIQRFLRVLNVKIKMLDYVLLE